MSRAACATRYYPTKARGGIARTLVIGGATYELHISGLATPMKRRPSCPWERSGPTNLDVGSPSVAIHGCAGRFRDRAVIDSQSCRCDGHKDRSRISGAPISRDKRLRDFTPVLGIAACSPNPTGGRRSLVRIQSARNRKKPCNVRVC